MRIKLSWFLSGNKSNEEDEDDEDELLHLGASDTDDEIGPVLQVKAFSLSFVFIFFLLGLNETFNSFLLALILFS